MFEWCSFARSWSISCFLLCLSEISLYFWFFFNSFNLFSSSFFFISSSYSLRCCSSFYCFNFNFVKASIYQNKLIKIEPIQNMNINNPLCTAHSLYVSSCGCFSRLWTLSPAAPSRSAGAPTLPATLPLGTFLGFLHQAALGTASRNQCCTIPTPTFGIFVTLPVSTTCFVYWLAGWFTWPARDWRPGSRSIQFQ